MEHLESQLRMALDLNDEVDQRWMEDVEVRNRQQARTMRSFEEKCRRLYDTRLREYEERTDRQLAEYEQALLEVQIQISSHIIHSISFFVPHSFLFTSLLFTGWVFWSIGKS